MSGVRRCTMSLPSDLVEKLDKLSALVGVSRSALVAELLGESVDVLDSMLQFAAVPSPENLRRLRGDSARVVQEKVSELKGLLEGDLFAGV